MPHFNLACPCGLVGLIELEPGGSGGSISATCFCGRVNCYSEASLVAARTGSRPGRLLAAMPEGPGADESVADEPVVVSDQPEAAP